MTVQFKKHLARIQSSLYVHHIKWRDFCKEWLSMLIYWLYISWKSGQEKKKHQLQDTMWISKNNWKDILAVTVTHLSGNINSSSRVSHWDRRGFCQDAYKAVRHRPRKAQHSGISCKHWNGIAESPSNHIFALRWNLEHRHKWNKWMLSRLLGTLGEFPSLR